MIIECPKCESKVDGKICGEMPIEEDSGGAPMKAVLITCPACGDPLLGWSEVVQTGHDDWDWSNAHRLWPPVDDAINWEIPEIARISLVEAKACFKAKAFSACAVMCGRTLEGVCKDHDPNTRTLAKGLQKLKTDGIIDKRLFEWSEALRKHRNLGAHATTEKVTKEDAQDLLDFSIAICEYVYILNAKYERFKQRQEKKKT